MLGIIVQLLISWLLLWIIEKKHLSALGLTPTAGRMRDLLSGLLASLRICALYNFATTLFVNNRWIWNPEFTSAMLLNSTWWNLKSVLYEELIFRGALLFIAMRKLGEVKACLLSAACFGTYHWFSFSLFGNPVQMVFIFLMTGIAGLAFAFAFSKTESLYLPVGLHLGWNLCTNIVFSNGPMGQQLFIKENENKQEGVLSLMIFLFQVVALPLITYGYLKLRSNRRSSPGSW